MLRFSRAPNRDGWWDQGVHEVDGYWVTWEQPCEPVTDGECRTAVDTATSILHADGPRRPQLTGAVRAGYPMMHGDGPNEMSFTFGGLVQPAFVILDLADGVPGARSACNAGRACRRTAAP